MNTRKTRRKVLIATAHAELLAWTASLDKTEWERTDAVLAGLAQLGHVVRFSIGPTSGSIGHAELLSKLKRQFGDFVVDALCRAPPPRGDPAPAYLMPVWGFDHEVDSLPASTARFLGMDLEVCAKPTEDEELGVTLPNTAGSWLIGARPIHNPHFFGKVRTTGH